MDRFHCNLNLGSLRFALKLISSLLIEVSLDFRDHWVLMHYLLRDLVCRHLRDMLSFFNLLPFFRFRFRPVLTSLTFLTALRRLYCLTLGEKLSNVVPLC